MSACYLSSQQSIVINALSGGATLTAAASEAGIHRNTINHWRRNSAIFQNALADAQYDRALYYREKIEELFAVALQTVQEILADPKAPASVKLKAALTIIQTATNPPMPDLTQMHKSAQSSVEQAHNIPPSHNSKMCADRNAAPPTGPKNQVDARSFPVQNPPALHNSAQSESLPNPKTPPIPSTAQHCTIQTPLPADSRTDAQSPNQKIPVHARPFAAEIPQRRTSPTAPA